MEKRLGKIQSVSFGLGGYQECMLGLSITLGNDGWGVGDFKGFWDPEQITRSENTQWTEEERDMRNSETMRFVSKLLNEAKVKDLSKLKNVPVEVSFEGNQLKDWRILTEVL